MLHELASCRINVLTGRIRDNSYIWQHPDFAIGRCATDPTILGEWSLAGSYSGVVRCVDYHAARVLVGRCAIADLTGVNCFGASRKMALSGANLPGTIGPTLGGSDVLRHRSAYSGNADASDWPRFGRGR